MKQKLFIILLTTLLCSIVESSAQKVGVVFSGGGAKGLYHVGILKALEEQNIPIDYISGASMGAIVGAMYSSGYSPDEMLQFFATDSVQTWLKGELPQEYAYYFKKYEPTPEMVSVNINPGKTSLQTLQLPVNLISPYRIDLALMEMLQPSSWAAHEQFDSLMVPFRCVASDVFNKKLISFSSGSLPFAVRASMTIPFAFKPLIYDTVLLYDGGVYNNFPWQVLQEDFQPDIIIGGNCSGNNSNPSQEDLMGQITVMIMDTTDYALPGEEDLMVHRRFPEVGTLEYNKAVYVMTLGYEDAMKMMPQIKERISRRVSQREIHAKREAFKSRTQPLVFESIEIMGLNDSQKDYVLRQLGLTTNQTFDIDYFERKYMRILATGHFSGEFPEVELNPHTGQYKLLLSMAAKPSIKVSLGGNISSTSLNQAFLGFNYLKIGKMASNYYLTGDFGLFYNAANVGARYDYYTQFPLYLQYNYTYQNIWYDNTNNANAYKDVDSRLLSNINNCFSLTLGVPIWNNWALRTNLSVGTSTYDYFQRLYTSADISDRSQLTYGSVSLALQKRQMDYTIYPTVGSNNEVSARFVAASEKYSPGSLSTQQAISGVQHSWLELKFKIERFIDISPWFSLGYSGCLTLSNHHNFANEMITDITSPCYAPTTHSSTLYMKEFHSPSYLGAGLIPVIKFDRQGKFYTRLYAYGYVPQEMVWVMGEGFQSITKSRLEEYVQGIFGGEIVYQTIVGPASFTIAKYTTSPKNWAFVLNFGYLLFNNKGI
ncbi:MAG: patatin-like phospholipase family protein [Rikenellaceae bacterium]